MVLVLDVVVHLVAVTSEATDGDNVLVAEVQTLHGAVGRVGPEILIFILTYMVAHLLANLGGVDFDFGMFLHLAHMLSHFCQFDISPGRTRQRVEQDKSKSTQPRFARRLATL